MSSRYPTCKIQRQASSLAEDERAVVVRDPLSKIDIRLDGVSFEVVQFCAQNRHVTVTLDAELDVIRGLGEIFTIPSELSCRYLAYAI